jgi:hypothetical protein
MRITITKTIRDCCLSPSGQFPYIYVDKKLQFDETGCLSWGGGNQVHLLKSSEKAEILAWKQNNVVKFIDGVQVCALEPK